MSIPLEVDEYQELSDNVDHGALTLDEHREGWHNTVRGAMTAGLFNMTQWERCMVGTLEMAKYDDGIHMIVFNGLAISLHEAPEYGFDVPMSMAPNDDSDYARGFNALDAMWRVEVDLRVARDAARMDYDALPWYRRLVTARP
jgi:hypothetical protein